MGRLIHRATACERSKLAAAAAAGAALGPLHTGGLPYTTGSLSRTLAFFAAHWQSQPHTGSLGLTLAGWGSTGPYHTDSLGLDRPTECVRLTECVKCNE